MGTNQRITQSVYEPNRIHRAQLYGPLTAISGAEFTPDFRGAAVGRNIADTANNLAGNMMAVHQHYQRLEEKTRLRADNNAITMAEMYFKTQQQNFAPQLDPEKGKLAIERAINDFKSYSAKLEGVSTDGRQRLEDFAKIAAETFKARQRSGRMKLIEQQSEALHKTSLKQAVESGNAPAVSQWVQACKEKNYQLQQSEAELQSRAAFFKLKNNIQASPVSELKAIDELLQDVDKKGSSKVYKGMSVDDVRRARREVAGLIAQKQADNHNSLIKDIESGKVSALEDIEELYKQDKISLKTLQGFRKNYASGQKKATSAAKNKLEMTIYKASQIVDPVRKKEYFNNLKENVLASGLAIPDKLALCKDIDRLRNAENKPGSDQTADNLIYGNQQLKEHLYDKLKVYEKKDLWGADWLWKDEYHKEKTKAMKESESEALKRWIKAAHRTTPEIDEYIETRKKKYIKGMTLKGFYRHFSGVDSRKGTKVIKGDKIERVKMPDGRIALFNHKTKKFIAYE